MTLAIGDLAIKIASTGACPNLAFTLKHRIDALWVTPLT